MTKIKRARRAGKNLPEAKDPRCSWPESGSEMAGEEWPRRAEITPLRSPPKECWCWTPCRLVLESSNKGHSSCCLLCSVYTRSAGKGRNGVAIACQPVSQPGSTPVALPSHTSRGTQGSFPLHVPGRRSCNKEKKSHETTPHG